MDRARSISAMATLLGASAYMITTAGRVGWFYYLPHEGVWTLHKGAAVVAMDWYARALWTLGATALGALLGRQIADRIALRTARAIESVAVLVLLWAAGFTVLWLVRGDR